MFSRNQFSKAWCRYFHIRSFNFCLFSFFQRLNTFIFDSSLFMFSFFFLHSGSLALYTWDHLNILHSEVHCLWNSPLIFCVDIHPASLFSSAAPISVVVRLGWKDFIILEDLGWKKETPWHEGNGEIVPDNCTCTWGNSFDIKQKQKKSFGNIFQQRKQKKHWAHARAGGVTSS